MNPTQETAIQPRYGDQRPSENGPGSKRLPARMRMAIGIPSACIRASAAAGTSALIRGVPLRCRR